MKVEKILIPTDFSHNAQLAFDHAYELARLLQAKLYILHVQEENTLRTAVMEGLLSDHSTDRKLENEVDRLIQSRLSTTLAGHAFPEVIVERLSLRGDPEKEIPAYARDINADLMVVGMRGTSMLEKVKSVVLGSVATSLIEKSPCPILLIRPDYVT